MVYARHPLSHPAISVGCVFRCQRARSGVEPVHMWKIPSAKAYGGVLLTKGGRILLREPTNHFDGYVWTYAKGRSDAGETPEQAALREVREETGYEAEVVDVLPGVFKGGTTTNAFFVMRHLGPRGRTEWETASVRWVDFYAAETLIAQTTNTIGRTRDLAILAATKAWFDGNQTVVLPDDECLPYAARQYDWKTEPMPARHRVVPLDFSLTAAEAERVRMGFVPKEQEQHWFVWFDENTLHQHRSWTGNCIDQIHFVPEGGGLRATHAKVNNDPEQYRAGTDEAEARRIEGMVRELACMHEAPESPSSLMQAIELASQPNYLGSPETVAGLIKQFFAAHEPGPNGLSDWSAKQAATKHITRVMCEDSMGYTRMPGWHTETALGQNLITAFNLDPGYCAGEDLAFLVSEALAALSMAIAVAVRAIGEAIAESENPEDHEEAEDALQELLRFAVWSFLGTQMLMAPGKTLKDVFPQR